jgi:hypothetical protein
VGPASASGVVVSDPLPAELAAPTGVLSPTLGTASYDAGTRTVRWNVGDMADLASGELVIDARVDQGSGVVRNTADITSGSIQDPDLTDNRSFIDIAIDTANADLQLTVDETTTIDVNVSSRSRAGFQTTVTNTGPSDAVDVRVEVWAAGIELESAYWWFEGAKFDCAPFTDPPLAKATCPIGVLRVGQSVLVAADGKATQGNSNYGAEVFSGTLDLVPSNNRDQGVLLPLTIADNKTNCFIATAAYGSYLEPNVMVLRRWRDRWLLTNGPGRAFVAWYYRTSPPIAAFISRHAWARVATRAALTPIVYGIRYPTTLLFALALALAWRFQRRHRIARRPVV